MDKKSLAVVVVLGIVLIGIIIGVFVYDANANSTIAEINRVKYNKSDFESYLKVWQYENGEEPVDLDEMYNNYKIYKLYTQYADNYHVELPSGEKVSTLTESEITKLSEKYALTENEYMRVKTEIAEVDYLFANLQDYWIVSDEEYESHKGANADLFKMYDYRVMQVNVEQPEEKSGDVSGDISGDEAISGDSDEQIRKNNAKSKAVEALAKVKSGDSFEEVAKEYGASRITYSNGGYTIVNGTKETVSGLFMNSYVWDQNIIKALTTLKKGEYSEIYESEGYYMFVYLEDIREGLDKEDENNYKRQIANEHIQSEALMVDNRIALKRIKVEKLIPILNKEIKEDISGETNGAEEVISGDGSLSGEAQ